MGLDGTDVLLWVIGAFYAFAGHVATRAALTSHFVDCAIAAIEGKQPGRIEVAQNYWLLGAAALVLAGGAALLFMLDIAAWLFAASAVGQAIYLFGLAPLYFDRNDPPDPDGRRRSTNAFLIYLLATSLVLWALANDKLTRWDEAGWLPIVIPAAIVAAHVAYVLWTIASAPLSAPVFGRHHADAEMDSDAPAADVSQSTAIKVMADYYAYPLWAADEGLYGDFPPEQLGLSAELTSALNDWAEAFTSSLDPDRPGESRWSGEQHRAHEAEARELAVRLARERPDRRIFIMDRDAGTVEIKGIGHD